MEQNENIVFEYFFTFQKGEKEHFTIKLDAKTLKYINENQTATSDWAKLDYQKCSNCPLNSAEREYCPIALNLVSILPAFKERVSYDIVDFVVKTEERFYCAKTSLQHGLGSMLGIYMVTSGCPIMAKLKTMVRFHLPFASIEETVFRSVSSYLLGQYFRFKNNLKPDWNLEGLIQIYEEVQKVNMGMAERLRSVPAEDANINALIVLDVFAKELPQSIDESLNELAYLFSD
jgi:hypothetical protein